MIIPKNSIVNDVFSDTRHRVKSEMYDRGGPAYLDDFYYISFEISKYIFDIVWSSIGRVILDDMCEN